ncbi:general amino acid permease AGP2 [Lentinula edodes]|uniref:general amino acid permease AGP2 n=1 Tax=Lentinula edodes TaxID=5353 RepID=UPI001E8CE46C|nr:general amino acid permease AGP2 [Lentinula edodes]KAH7873547.1 general amino acid permease AGP2 [Lentinula edodes]
MDMKSNDENFEQASKKNDDDFDFQGSSDHTHRKLKSRHIQLMAIGGTIGTALFVQIGQALTEGGPASLFIAFTLWSTFILAINSCLSEMVTWIPITSPFVRFADHFVDPALGLCAGVNFFIFEAALIPFEVTAFNVVLQFWTDKIPLVAVICFVLLCYLALNLWTVRYFGESEFWFASGKVILAVGLIFFTFITMVGGNPIHDAYGFRFWDPSRVQGAPFAEYIRTGSLGRFLGFLSCLIQASFTIAGPDMVSIAAGEAQNPRRILPRAFKSVFYRLTTFFVLGSLCIGIVVSYSDPNLLQALSDARPGAGSSPYVIAMQRLHIKVLPDIVNALILTSIFSAGNSYVYNASRTLYELALEGKAPKVFKRCNRNGVPVWCVIATLGIALLSFLQVSNNSAVVLQWFVNLVTASQLLNYAIICFTYLRFYKALKVQGISRDTLPHKSFWQPFSAYYGFTGTIVMAFVGGYTVFLPGRWDVPSFFFSYTMIGVLPVLFVYWKIYRQTKWRKLEDITFLDNERLLVDRYEEECVGEEPSSILSRIWNLLQS